MMARALDDETRDAAVKAVEVGKALGWTQDELREWFDKNGVALSDYTDAKAGKPISDEVRGTLAMLGITGLPFRDPYPDLPEQMKAAKRWLVWKAVPHENPDKKPIKKPFYASGKPRGGTPERRIALDTPEDVQHFATYAEACAVAKNYTGIAFALGPDDRGGFWQGIDLDNLDQHPGLKFVAEDLPGYTEKSPSGGGVHAIGYGVDFVSLGSNKTGIEAYAKGRYFTVTGESTGLGELTCLADFVEKRLLPLHGARPQDTSAPAQAAASGGSITGSMAGPDLRAALAHLRADDYDLWIRMGHALKPLGEQGRGLWLEWSQTSEKYDPADARRWDTFQPQRTGYQAVFAEAQRQGWKNPGRGSSSSAGGGENPRHDPETGEIIEDKEPEPVSRPFRASEFVGEPPEREWIIPEWIVAGSVNSLYGDGGLGKTLLAQQLACAVAAGGKWLGMQATQGSVLAVLCEDERDELHRRHNSIKAAMGHVVGNPFDDVWLWPRVGDENILLTVVKDSEFQFGAFMGALKREVQEIRPSLLILDTLADFYAGNEISRPQVNYFVKTALGGLIKAQKEVGHILTILLLGHPSVAGKTSGSGYSGSTAWNAAVRSRIYLSRPPEDDGPSDERILTRGKANYAKSGDETAIRLFYADGILRAAEDVEDGDSLLWAVKEEVCKLVDQAWRNGRPYSGQKGHQRHVYAALPNDLKRAGYEPPLIRQALRELIDDGVVNLSKGRDKRGYRTSKSGD